MHDECGFEDEERQQCGRETDDELECYSRGCCYRENQNNESNVVCFLAHRKLASHFKIKSIVMDANLC